MVKIRFTQTGAKNRRTYRIIAIEEGKRRNGEAIEILGFYNPNRKPAEISIKRDRVQYWISVGAQPSASIQKLLNNPTS